MNLPADLNSLKQLVAQAGTKTLEYWRQPLQVMDKADASPVTAADLAAHAMLVEGLQQLTPEIPILSEEDAEAPLAERLKWQRFWLIDPLDGTKEFIDGSDEFTVNLALIEEGQVRFGLVGVPARGTLYWGGLHQGSWCSQADGSVEQLHTRAAASPLQVVASRRHTSAEQEAMLARLQNQQRIERVSIGSSLKFCLLAEAQADFYPRFAPTCQWDTAAAQAVLEGAGGAVLGIDGQRFSYPHRQSWLNPHFIALGRPDPALLGILLPDL